MIPFNGMECLRFTLEEQIWREEYMNWGVGAVNSQHKLPKSNADNWVCNAGNESLSESLLNLSG